MIANGTAAVNRGLEQPDQPSLLYIYVQSGRDAGRLLVAFYLPGGSCDAFPPC